MPQILVEDLCKTFQVAERESGLWGAARGLLRRRHRKVCALDGVSFALEAGEMVGYIGPNGAGKSTTIKMLTGILVPSGGSIRVVGLDPSRKRVELARRIGVVFGQRSQLWWDLPLRDSFELLRHVYRVGAAPHAARLAECVGLLDLGPLLPVPVRQLSLGQRMRGELTAALLHEPEVLFLDEPTIGLDVVSKQAVREFLTVLGRRGDTTLSLTTHDLADIERLCRRLVIVDHGRVVHDGTAEELHSRYGSRRRVVVDLDEPLAEPVTLPGVALESAEGLRLTYQLVDGTNAGALVARLAAAASLRDLAVVEPAIEDVIARLYARGATG